ncbi:polyphosphate kinase 1 [Sulfuricystis multivorans]|uniref:polyphosphate kinase 1 n=1 Tax=Sulfuricystis multivorans TaxID=2211108 RepID=UPI000F84BE28|nr:polyphosphate kinase 1 [Sulfuricystis multivorans]
MTTHSAATPAFPADHFLNRELSLLAFNRRVLAQAADTRVPLLERLRFLCIVSSNLDEFFEIRVAGIKEQIKLKSNIVGADGRTPQEVFRLVTREAHRLIEEQYALLNQVILPALRKEGICFFRRSEWTEAQEAWIHDYFRREVMPVLTPIGLDPAHPFPRVLNKSLNFAVELEGTDAFGRAGGAAIVQAPRALPRVIQLPRELTGIDYGFIFLSSVMHRYVGELFAGMNVLGCYQFRVTRNSDLFVDEEEVKNLRTALQGELPQRHFGDAVRLEVPDNCSPMMVDFLLQQFGLGRDDLYQVHGIVNLVRLISVPDRVDRPDLKFKPFQPGLPKPLSGHQDMFAAIRKGDILLHHPYQSFTPVIDFLQQAADDPQVVAIKMTVYRTGTDSVLMEHLLRAAQKGKEVTVVVELMARFDEEANLSIAARLEEVGAHVVYGVFGYKTHAKMMLVLRREDQGYRRYVHLGTGNYHPRTTRFYTDFGLLSCHDEITADVNEIFKQLTGLGKAVELKHLWQAPFTLHDNMLAAIREETKIAKAGGKAQIIAKMNALLEPQVIEALYAASQAGVKIDLIVRGVCCLRPGVPGLSENIRVRSVIGRFLEHHRIFYFHADGAERLYLGSADWMERNFFRRIEVCFPVLDPKLKRRVIREGLRAYLADNCQAWDMDSDGDYRVRPSRRVRTCAQELLLGELAER